jgi:3-deoxy-D-manno-octulosonate 8-phosphate phosphatase (KDO 8-P phosphatase)
VITRLPTELRARVSAIKLAAFDVDGVLTDGRLLLGPTGEEFKQFHVRDGHGLVMLREAGFKLAVISGRAAPVVARRMTELGVHHVYQGCKDKLAALHDLCARTALAPHEIAYMGDDEPDVPVLRAVGFGVAVADAHPAAIAAACFQTRAAGGHGAAREVADLILALQLTATTQ